MDDRNLIRMANRIGDFFEGFADRDEALEGIANHLQKFCEPRMRRALFAWVDAHLTDAADDATLSPLVRAAIAAHRARLAPAETV